MTVVPLPGTRLSRPSDRQPSLESSSNGRGRLRQDRYDVIGAAVCLVCLVCLVGVTVIMYAPRSGALNG